MKKKPVKKVAKKKAVKKNPVIAKLDSITSEIIASLTKENYIECVKCGKRYDKKTPEECKEKESVIEQKHYTPTRLDYFVAHIVTGCLAKSCGSSNPKEIVDYAKELIAEIDEQEGEK